MNFDEFVKLILVAIATVGGFYLNLFIKEAVTWLQNKTINGYVDFILSKAEDDLTKAINTTTQTFVNELKKEGKFDKEAQKEAFEKSKLAFLQTISKETLETLKDTKGDYEKWIENFIENAIENKKGEFLFAETIDLSTALGEPAND